MCSTESLPLSRDFWQLSRLLRIQEHCRVEEQIVESPFQIWTMPRSHALAQEHELLRQLTNDFLRELTFAAVFRISELVRSGVALLEQARRHIAHETRLLKQIEEGKASRGAVAVAVHPPGRISPRNSLCQVAQPGLANGSRRAC